MKCYFQGGPLKMKVLNISDRHANECGDIILHNFNGKNRRYRYTKTTWDPRYYNFVREEHGYS